MTAAVRFGQMLQQARQLRGLSREQLANEASIPLGHVEALEAGLLRAIPGGLYLRAEARAYAEVVALDPQLVLGALREALVSDAAVLPPPIAVAAPSAVIATDVPGAPIDIPVASPLLLSADAAPLMSAAQPADRIARIPIAAPLVSRSRSRLARRPRGRWRFAAALLLGGAALLFEQASRSPAVPSELSKMAAVDVPLDRTKVFDNVVTLAEAASAPALSQTLFAPRTESSRPWGPVTRLEAGRLVVQSTPAGARVTVNGVGWGVTPVAIRYLPLGTMRVRLVKDNYRAQERLVELTSGTPTSTLRVTLPQIPGRSVATTTANSGPMLVVNTTPPGARVTVNGIGWGSTPVLIPHLPLGPQRLRVVKDQFISEERVVQLAEGQSTSVTIALRRAESQ